MSRLGIGIVDYGVGNLTSVGRTLYALGYRCKISSRPEDLDAQDLLVLPGVGAFPPAMAALEARGLTGYLRDRAAAGRPLLGICLGMQLLAESSTEYGLTAGLGLIRGRVCALPSLRSHIGWNQIALAGDDPLFSAVGDETFYFNHSFALECAPGLVRATATLRTTFPVIVRQGAVIGIQFHPEKSQLAGRNLLRNVIHGLCHD
ncbi:MAG: imidazole glycerol phosphate synthase subunit HisH [Verrucomicrobia bacterium]|nr:imidazole glycerol phosphate synthase subunit HisH [Verrucomicrobiota bacterium]